MKKFKHVIIWGHALHTHTHSYVHNAFYRAFASMGYDVKWFDDSNAEAAVYNWQDCLFITEGQVCKNMPLIKGNTYILHNCYDQAMWDKINSENIDYLKLQVYTNDVLNYNLPEIEPFIFHDAPGRMIYMPWSTDLLPNEIIPFPVTQKTTTCHWIGTLGDGEFGNREQINPFVNACRDNGIGFEQWTGLSIEQNRNLISESYMAPAIVGKWQKEKGYIPCRIFKNVSYGNYAMTNSKAVHDLFQGAIIYSEHEYELFEKMIDKMGSRTYTKDLIDNIKFVRDKHTYINRINTLLSVL